jgi:hypothetical protein
METTDPFIVVQPHETTRRPGRTVRNVAAFVTVAALAGYGAAEGVQAAGEYLHDHLSNIPVHVEGMDHVDR